MKLGRIITTLAVGGAAIALIGTGVASSFTDSATAKDNISVGTFGISISSTTAGAVVTNSGVIGSDVHTVVYTAPTIQSSAAGSAPLEFTITNTGSMPASVSVVSSDGFAAPWSDMFVNPGTQVIAVGGHFDYNGGMAWTALGNADLGSSHSVTYTITATA